MRMVPHGRSLVTRMEGRPFAFLGVNVDRDAGQANATVEARAINWRSWHLPPYELDEVLRQWKVAGWPTFFLIDAKGVVRFAHLFAPPPADVLDREVDQLVAEAEG